MELESLKYIWRSLEAPAAPEPDRRAMAALLHRRSQGLVGQMRRNLIGEAILLLAAYIPAIMVYVVEFDGRLSAIAWMFAGVAVIFFGYYYRKYRLLADMQCPSCHVRSNLARQVATLQRYTRFYLVAGTGMIPVTYVLSWLIIRWKLTGTRGLTPDMIRGIHPGPWWASPIFWFAALVPFTIAVYFLNRWYINRLYGRHIKKLQEFLREMESGE
jgi:hypothetical protein